MDNKQELSARLRATLEGCYEGPRAAALSGVPVSTVYYWARLGIVEPSVSPTRIKLWSYADLMALRIVYWLRHETCILCSCCFATLMSQAIPATVSTIQNSLTTISSQSWFEKTWCRYSRASSTN